MHTDGALIIINNNNRQLRDPSVWEPTRGHGSFGGCLGQRPDCMGSREESDHSQHWSSKKSMELSPHGRQLLSPFASSCWAVLEWTEQLIIMLCWFSLFLWVPSLLAFQSPICSLLFYDYFLEERTRSFDQRVLSFSLIYCLHSKRIWFWSLMMKGYSSAVESPLNL